MAREPQESLFDWLASLVKGLGIKMRTDKFTAPQFFDLPPKSRGRQVPVVIERVMLQVQFDTESFSLAVATEAVAVCAPSATGL